MMAGAPDVNGSAQQPADPRQSREPAVERDIRPVVERPRRGLSNAAIGGLAVVAALGLFGALEARRQRVSAPATMLARDDRVESAAPPPLYVPPAPIPTPFTIPAAPEPVRSRIDEPQRLSAPPPVSARIVPAPSYEMPQAAPAQQRPPRNVGGQSFVVDTSGASPQATVAEEPETGGKSSDNSKRPGLSTARARAAMLANRSTTVPQGTLIPAVLETAFDSTSPGFARALIQKDVHGFDGTRVLIPRGSRLIGEYGADAQRGQKRAIILWSRLIRPDGVTIEIGSPAADPVGRGGVKADVNTHFFERFSGAILQSAFDLGITLAARNSQSPVIVALPGAGGRVTSPAPSTAGSNDITPTLRVPAGRSVSVFVARDLDFTQAESLR